MTIQTRLVEYSDGDTVLEGYLAWDDAADRPRPGVMVSHAWAGRGDLEDGKARALAELGYTGFALNLYGKGVRGTSTEENAALMQPFLDDRGMLQRRMRLSLNTMREQAEVDDQNVAAIGFCFGGLCVLDLARTGEDLAGVISFHGLFPPPGNTAGITIKAKVLALHGWDDPLVPPQDVVSFGEEMTNAGVDWQLVGYGGTMHAFTDPQADRPDIGGLYNKDADRRSWIAMQNFLAEVLA